MTLVSFSIGFIIFSSTVFVFHRLKISPENKKIEFRETLSLAYCSKKNKIKVHFFSRIFTTVIWENKNNFTGTFQTLHFFCHYNNRIWFCITFFHSWTYNWKFFALYILNKNMLKNFPVKYTIIQSLRIEVFQALYSWSNRINCSVGPTWLSIAKNDNFRWSTGVDPIGSTPV